MENDIKYYPLTHPQKAVWFNEKLHPDTSISNIAATLKINSSVDFMLLEKAINIIIEKNDALRLRFVEQDGVPKQYISEYTYKKIYFFDFSDKGIESLYEWDFQKTNIPFQLIDSDLYYFAL
ncbi:MAG: condensation domain-containing protein, partial [Clostridiaceae bacterium]